MPESRGSCPYAVGLSDDEETSSHSEVENVLELAKKSCPAFVHGSCPFRDAKNANDVRHALLQVPPSHLKESGHFYKALRHLHAVSQSMEQPEEFSLPGGCPVQTYAYTSDSAMPFVTAMEEWSLASIMAKMAQDIMGEGNDGGNNDEGQVDGESLATSNETQVLSNHTNTAIPLSLSEALKTGTAASHKAAEDVHFVRNFIHGKIDRTLYGELVLALYHVYDSLEQALDQHAPHHFAPCHFPNELSRKETLGDDIDFWHGSVPDRVSPATVDYMERIRHIAETEPLLLLSHAYTRYLGDLSGGRILARVARKAMQLGDDGLRFYEFDNVDKPKQFKDQYRNALDQLALSRTQISKLVAEANVAFVLNMRIFEELDVMANIPGASVRNLEEALDFASKPSEEGVKAECPFANMPGAASLPNPHATTTAAGKRCPWPFVFFHDPVAGMHDWQTWIVLGLLFCLVWSRLQGLLVVS